MDGQSSEDLWAVVFSGGRAYVGVMTTESGDELRCIMKPCYEITVHLVPTRGPDGQPVMSKNISAEPVLLSFEGSPVCLSYTGLMIFKDMEEGDRNRYKKLADAAAALALEARAAQAGIVPPGGQR